MYILPTGLLIRAERWLGFSGKNAPNARRESWASLKKKAAKSTRKLIIMSATLAAIRKAMSKWKTA